jgi:hypothetical protein
MEFKNIFQQSVCKETANITFSMVVCILHDPAYYPGFEIRVLINIPATSDSLHSELFKRYL